MAGGRSAIPAVASPNLLDVPSHDDDHCGEGDPEVEDPSSALGAPDQLLVGVVSGVRALYHSTFCER
jgi:hypothetical protein